MLAETPRGATPRYWDDVQVGEEIDTITKGPIGLTDEIALRCFRCRTDPAARRAWRRAAALPEAPALGLSRSRRTMPSSLSIPCTTTTTRLGSKGRRRRTTSASSARAGRSTRSRTGWVTPGSSHP